MNNIMVCVTLQNTCERLINAAAEIKGDADMLFVLHVSKNGQAFMGGIDEAASLEYLYSVSQKAGANMTVMHADDVFECICSFITDHSIDTVVLGMPSTNEKDNGLITALETRLNGKIKLVLIDKQKGVFLK